jgi:1-acyl-sn-glycerol-3-phosphate acyltransferase
MTSRRTFLPTILCAVLLRCSNLDTTFAFVPHVQSRIPVVHRRGPDYKTSSSSQFPADDATTTNLFRAANVIGAAVATSDVSKSLSSNGAISPLVAVLTKVGMLSFIACVCLALPVTLYPQKVLYRLGVISKRRKERWALSTGQFCSRNLLRLIPFCTLETIGAHDANPQPAIWVCNHTSALDVFLLMAADRKLRGRKRRPIKIVYWKNLDDNPVTKLLFRQSGFIPVAMAANKNGEDNEYERASFKPLLKEVKRAFEEDFDVALMPEGQYNPTPELGLLPIFGGAYTMAKMSRRPIHMMALHGIDKLAHSDAAIGMTAVTSRHVKIRTYPNGRHYNSAEEFKTTFEKVVGQFGATGRDLTEKELNAWLTGNA